MKIRWTKESIRFRITPSELNKLAAFEQISEEITFPGLGFWRVAIVPSRSKTEIFAAISEVVVRISDLDIERLAALDVEGVYFTESRDTPLNYIIEKDFPCIHPRSSNAAEAPTETFEPPIGFGDRKKSPLL